MKLIDVVKQIQEQDGPKKGTYAGVRFDTDTNKRLHKFMSENKIPTSVRPDKLHTTVLYSRKHLPNYKPAGAIKMTGNPTAFDVWKTRGENSAQTNCLVLGFDCPALVERHKALMKEHGATFDYPEYKTHVTLSYDIGDMDVKNLPEASSIGPLNIVEEYGEDLDLDWARNKGVKKGG